LFLLEIERLWSWRTVGIERENKRQLRRQERLARGYPNAIAKARLYEAALAEPGATYRTVARRLGVTREEICQYTVVLKRLPPEMIAAVEHERDPLRLRQFSLRRLLAVARSRRAMTEHHERHPNA
jgi:hypothetical protein